MAEEMLMLQLHELFFHIVIYICAALGVAATHTGKIQIILRIQEESCMGSIG